jgi:hypothetical protein
MENLVQTFLSQVAISLIVRNWNDYKNLSIIEKIKKVFDDYWQEFLEVDTVKIYVEELRNEYLLADNETESNETKDNEDNETKDNETESNEESEIIELLKPFKESDPVSQFEEFLFQFMVLSENIHAFVIWTYDTTHTKHIENKVKVYTLEIRAGLINRAIREELISPAIQEELISPAIQEELISPAIQEELISPAIQEDMGNDGSGVDATELSKYIECSDNKFTYLITLYLRCKSDVKKLNFLLDLMDPYSFNGKYYGKYAYKVVLYALDKGFDPDTKNKYDNGLLWTALFRALPDIVELLFIYGASLSQCDCYSDPIKCLCSEYFFARSNIKHKENIVRTYQILSMYDDKGLLDKWKNQDMSTWTPEMRQAYSDIIKEISRRDINS